MESNVMIKEVLYLQRVLLLRPDGLNNVKVPNTSIAFIIKKDEKHFKDFPRDYRVFCHCPQV